MAGSTGRESIRDRYRRILDLFPTVDKAELRIDRVYWDAADADGYPADVRLIVRGTRADGSAAQLDQRMHVHIAQRSKDWRITAEEVTAREMVSRASRGSPSPPRKRASRTSTPTRARRSSGCSAARRAAREPPSPTSTGTAARTSSSPAIPRRFSTGTTATARSRTSPRSGAFPTPSRPSPPAPCSSTTTTTAGPICSSRRSRAATASSATSGQRGAPLRRRHRRGRHSRGRLGEHADRRRLRPRRLPRRLRRPHGRPREDVPEPNYEANNGLANPLLHNNGDGTFTDVTRQARRRRHAAGASPAPGATTTTTAGPICTSPTSSVQRALPQPAATARSRT